MSSEISSLSQLSFLRKENYDLRVELDQLLCEMNNIREKYNKLCTYSKTLEGFIDNINHKIFKLKGLESPLLKIVDEDPALTKLGYKFEEEWTRKHPKPILESVKEEDEETNFDSEYENPFRNKIDHFEDIGMNEDDDFDSLKYYFSDEQLEEINLIIGPHLEKMKENPFFIDSSVSYDARKDVALKALNDLHLKIELRSSIEDFGWQKIYINELSTVIPVILEGHHVIMEDPVQPNLHLRKIATLVLPILQQIRPSVKYCQALVLVPSRELAQKINRVVKALGKHLNVTSHVCVDGGSRLKEEVKILSDGVHVVIGTPGRVLDLIKSRTLGITKTKFLAVCDAVDLLTGTFAYHTKTIFLNLPEDKQVVLLTSSCNQEVTQWCDSFMKIRKTIPIKEIANNLDGVKQFYLNVKYRDMKWRPLMDIRHHFPNMRMVVICNSHKRVVEWLTYQMHQKGEIVLAANATMQPDECDDIIKQFAVGNITTLITTELLLRTEDIRLENVDLLVNYELPIMPQNYYDRISFCGLDFEKRGMVFNFITGKNQTQPQLLRKIEQFCDTKIIKLPITTIDESDED